VFTAAFCLQFIKEYDDDDDDDERVFGVGQFNGVI